MDRDLVALDRDHDDDLEEIPRRVRTDEKPTVGIFAGVFKREGMVDGVEDVFVGSRSAERFRSERSCA
jgi:hypothetical protein